MQRIRIGLTGLAFVFLLVLLGAVVSRSGRDGVGSGASVNAASANTQPTDPLSDLGVAPGLPTNSANSAGNNSRP